MTSPSLPPARRHPSGRGRIALGVTCSLALLLAACGDDGDDSTDTTGDGAEDTSDTGSDTGAAPVDTGDNPDGCVDDADSDGELFADQYEIRYAENFTLDYFDTYKVLTVSEPYPDAPEATYVLVQCGTDAPDLDGDLEDATVVDIPVETLHSQSTSHLGFLDELGAADTVTGVGPTDIVVLPSVREGIDNGDVTGFAPEGIIDTEAVILDDPDVFVTSGTEDSEHATLADAGIPVMANAEWLETSPLGWAEWIAFFAALTNTEDQASEIFAGIEDRYDEAVELAADLDDSPTVITGALNEGDWYARAGAGIVPRFIADAGGDYVYADDDETGSLVLDIETVLAEAGDAEVWISPTGSTITEAELLADDERYSQMAAWDEGGVWVDVEERDGISRYEHGPVMVDVMLLDYMAMIHPDEVDHDLVFFDPIG